MWNEIALQYASVARRQSHWYLPLDFLSKSHFDCQKVRQVLLKAVAGYSPTEDVADVVWQRRSSNARAKPSKVADIRRHRKPIPGT